MTDETNEAVGSTPEPTDEGIGWELTAEEWASMQARSVVLNQMGESFNGKRDLYKTFGWDKDPDPSDFYAMYKRNPFARAVVDNPAKTAWRNDPIIVDEATPNDDDKTQFEKDVEKLQRRLRVWHYGQRADQLAGIGEYGLLMIGFADGESQKFVNPVDTQALARANGLGIEWLRPLSQLSVTNIKYGEQGSGRFGLPQYYKIDLGNREGVTLPNGTRDIWVHHDRIVHIAEGRLDDEVFGTPREEPVFNNLADIEKGLGSAAEIAYTGAKDRLHINAEPGYEMEDGGNLEEQLERVEHELQSYIRTQGVDIERIEGGSFDPTHVVKNEVAAIAGQTRQPQSMLLGNETGERATSQDMKEWYGVVAERQVQFVAPVIIRGLLDRLTRFGVIARPDGNDYDIEWEPLYEDTAEETASVQESRSKVAKNLSGVVPDYGGKEWVKYVETGDFPDVEEAGAPNNIEPMDAENSEETNIALDDDGQQVEALPDGGVEQ